MDGGVRGGGGVRVDRSTGVVGVAGVDVQSVSTTTAAMCGCNVAHAPAKSAQDIVYDQVQRRPPRLVCCFL